MSGTGPEQFEVRGTVTDTDGQGLVGAEVIVWWQRIRERIELARGETSEQGRYVLRYSRPDDESRVGCIMPNLGWKLARWFSLQDQKIKGLPTQMLIVVEARSRHLDEPIKSPVMRAQPDLQINLEAQPRDRSEYATLLRSIRPLLENLTLLDIVEND